MKEILKEPKQEATAAQEPFKISIDDSMTLRQLVTVHNEQFTSIQRTPHVGNANLSHLAHYALGLPAILYDRNKGLKDSNFNPDGVVSVEGYERTSHPDILMTHAVVESPPTKEFHGRREWFRTGRSLAEAHTSSLRELFPESNLQHFTDYLAENHEVVGRVIEAANKVMPAEELWSRRVDATGETQTNGLDRRRRLRDPLDEVYGVSNQEEGWIVPNEVNVLLTAVIEAEKFGKDKVYHVSGPDMYKYVDTMQGRLSTLYESARRELPPGALPETLEFVVVPMGDMRFAVNSDRAETLDELVGMWPVYLDLQQQKKQFYSELYASDLPREEKDEARDAFVAEKENPVFSHIQRLSRSCPELFFDTKTKNYLTQYDMLDGYGRNLHVPEAVLDMTVGALNEMYRVYKKIAQSKHDF